MIKIEPYYDEPAERSILGTMLADPDVIPSVMNLVGEDDFYIEEHRLLFSVIVRLWQEHGSNWDEVVLRDYIRKEGLEDRLPLDWILGIYEDAAPLVTLETACRIVKEHSDRRKVGDLILSLASSLKKGEPVEDLLKNTLDRLLSIAGDSSKLYTKVDIAKLVAEYVKSAMERKEVYTGLPTGFTEVDEVTNGFRAGELIVFGARPAVGKTTLLVTLAEKFVESGYRVAFFSLEMPPITLGLKLASMVSGVPFRKLLSGFLSDEEYDSFLEKLLGYTRVGGDVYFDFRRHDHKSLVSSIFFLRKKMGIDVAMIDYFQLVKVKPGFGESMKDAYSALSTDLKMVAKELEIPVIVASQLRREAEHASKPPTIRDLKETGQLEQDADMIFLLWRDGKDNITRMRLAKNRLLGETAKFNLIFDKETHTYSIEKPGVSVPVQQEKTNVEDYYDENGEIPF